MPGSQAAAEAHNLNQVNGLNGFQRGASGQSIRAVSTRNNPPFIVPNCYTLAGGLPVQPNGADSGSAEKLSQCERSANRCYLERFQKEERAQLARIRSLIWRASFSISSTFLTRDRDNTSVSGVLSDSSFRSLTICSKWSTSCLIAFWSSLSCTLGSARGGRGTSSSPFELLASGICGM